MIDLQSNRKRHGRGTDLDRAAEDGRRFQVIAPHLTELGRRVVEVHAERGRLCQHANARHHRYGRPLRLQRLRSAERTEADEAKNAGRGGHGSS
jgi:hypothetical protein